MVGRVVVMEQAAYQAWLGGTTTGETLAQKGEKLFTQLACVTCHNQGSGARGPLLNGVWGHEVALAAGGTVVADASYIRESILNPTAKIVAGFQPLMPTFQGQVTEEQLLALTEYIKGLPGRGASAPAPAPAQPTAAPQQ
jgi:cytochrome c oxidase subunit 2